MMVEDFGSAAPVQPYYSGMSPQQLKAEINHLTAERDALNAQIEEFNKAPLRRMWNGFKSFVGDWYGVGIILLIVGSGVAAAVIGSGYREKKLIGGCEFAARIQNTKFEFDKYNERCYLYDKKFEKYIPHATQAP